MEKSKMKQISLSSLLKFEKEFLFVLKLTLLHISDFKYLLSCNVEIIAIFKYKFADLISRLIFHRILNFKDLSYTDSEI